MKNKKKGGRKPPFDWLFGQNCFQQVEKINNYQESRRPIENCVDPCPMANHKILDNQRCNQCAGKINQPIAPVSHKDKGADGCRSENQRIGDHFADGVVSRGYQRDVHEKTGQNQNDAGS